MFVPTRRCLPRRSTGFAPAAGLRSRCGGRGRGTLAGRRARRGQRPDRRRCRRRAFPARSRSAMRTTWRSCFPAPGWRTSSSTSSQRPDVPAVRGMVDEDGSSRTPGAGRGTTIAVRLPCTCHRARGSAVRPTAVTLPGISACAYDCVKRKLRSGVGDLAVLDQPHAVAREAGDGQGAAGRASGCTRSRTPALHAAHRRPTPRRTSRRRARRPRRRRHRRGRR